jgi:hypothetical protein
VQFQECLGVDADLVVDDELQTRQTNTSIRQSGEGNGLIGGADIHHDLDTDVRHAILLGLFNSELQ